ncbi:MAG: hypothetical protein AAFO58_02420, partial [Pseudomonadota bacterium]
SAKPPERGMGDLAAQFDHGSVSAAAAVNATRERPARNRAHTQAEGEVEKALNRAREIYEKIFDNDAKILGLVSLKELMKVLEGLENPNTGMPALDERIRYGAGQLQEGLASAREQLTDAAGELGDELRDELNAAQANALSDAADAADLVRVQVVMPLAEALEDIREGWDSLEAQLAEEQRAITPAQVRPITIREIFPELDGGLTALRAALVDSAEQTDQIAFALSLGAVYEAGRRFIDALKRSLANPVARIEGAFRERFDALRGVFNALTDGLGGILRAFAEEFVDDLRRKVADELPNQIVPEDRVITFSPIRIPRVDRFAALDIDVQTFADELRAAAALDTGDVRLLLSAFIHFTLEPARISALVSAQTPIDTLARDFLATRDYQNLFQGLQILPRDETVADQIGRRLKARENRVRRAVADLSASVRAALDDATTAIEEAARAEAEALLADLELLVVTLAGEAEQMLERIAQDFAEEFDFIARLILAVGALTDALSEDRIAPKTVIDRTVALLELLVGPLGINSDDICAEANSYLNPLRQIALYLNPTELALSDPAVIHLPFSVSQTDQLGERARRIVIPQFKEIAYADDAPAPSGKAPATHLYEAHVDLAEMIKEAYQERADALEELGDLPDDIPDGVRAKVADFVKVLDQDIEGVLASTTGVNNALVDAYAAILTADRQAIGLRARLAGIAEIDVCAGDIEDQLAAASAVPDDIARFIDVYGDVVKALNTSARTIGSSVETLIKADTLIVTGGVVGAFAFLADAFNAGEVFDELEEAATQKAREYTLRLHRLESRITVAAAGVLRDVIAPVRAQVARAQTFADGLADLADSLKDLISVEGLTENIETLAQLSADIAGLDAEMARIAAM